MKTQNASATLKVKTSLKAGLSNSNHNETQMRAPTGLPVRATTLGATAALKVKTSLKAGAGVIPNGAVKP